MLQTSAQLNVTVAIGIGTLEIAIKAPDKKRAKLIKEILVIITLNVFSFFISHVQIEVLQRVYFALSGVILIVILLSAFYYVINIKRK